MTKTQRRRNRLLTRIETLERTRACGCLGQDKRTDAKVDALLLKLADLEDCR